MAEVPSAEAVAAATSVDGAAAASLPGVATAAATVDVAEEATLLTSHLMVI